MAIKVSVKRYVDAPGAPPVYENTLNEPIITIGSDPAATVHLNNSAVAAEQVIIISDGGQPLLINRADGTILNGARMQREARHPLAHGDQLRIGGYLVDILFDAPQATSAGAASQTAQAARAPEARAARAEETGGRNVVSGNVPPVAASPPARDLAEIRTPPRQAAPPATPTPQATPPSTPRKSFASMLDSLRTEEDSFHFLVRGGYQSGLRVLLEGAAVEMPIGWDETGRNICFDAGEIAAPRAIVRKDWSGVVIEPQGAWGITINNDPVDAPRRLRNGDQLMLSAPAGKENNQQQPLLIFHEPASLVVLDSLLPQQTPAPVAPDSPPPVEDAFAGNGNASANVLPPAAMQATTNANADGTAAVNVAATPRRTFSERLFDKQRIFFGTFTLLEVLIMVAGTLIAAVFIFVLLTLLDSP